MSQGDDWGSFWSGEPGLESPSTPNSGYVEDWPSFYDSDPLLEQPPLSPSAFGLLLLDAADDAAARGLIGAEPNLGLPAANEYVLTSTTGGARSWVPLSPLLGLDWGNIGGALGSQTDLQAALNAKQNHSANLDSWSALAASTKQDALTFSQSVQNVSGTVTLTNDSGSPGNSQYYGTNSVGTRGFYDLPTSAIWGSITGTLSNQTDLQNALNGKEPTIAAGTTAQYWRGDKTWQTLNAEVPLTFSQSVSRSANTVTLTNDSATPGNSKYYGTNNSGTRGYFALPTGFSGNFTDLNFTGSNLTSIATRNFADLQSKPTTISGYGITDFNSLGDARWQPLGSYESPLTFTAPLARSASTVSIPAATAAQDGYLSALDWSTFNTKADLALYNETARVDPSGHDTGAHAGVIGRPDDRPFLTVQAAINAAEAMTPRPEDLVIITGNNSFTEDIITDLPRISFVGSETDDFYTSQAFNSLTASTGAIIVLNNVNSFNITATAPSVQLKVEMNNAYCSNVSSLGTNGTVEVFSDFATGWVYGDITADKAIRVYGVEIDGVVSSASSGDIHLSALQGPEGDPTACFPTIDSPSSNVTVDGGSLIHQVTACASLTLRDSRVYGTNNATTTTYADVLFGGPHFGDGSGLTNLSTSQVTDSTDKRYVTDAGLTVLGNTSGTNTGDQYGGVTASGASQYLRRNAGNTAYEFGTLPASGDFSSNTSTSVDSEVVLFSGTGGKTGKRATGSGLATLASGVLGTTTNNTTNWDTAYTDRLKWDGGATGLTANTGRTSLGLVIGTDVQAWDADLDALAALSGTHTMYYRSAANTWNAVTIGGGLDFTGATLSAPGGGSGTVTSIATTSPISGGTITSSGTISLLVNVDHAFTAAQSVTLAPAANTAVTGLLLTDTTAASSGNQQYSPAVRWTGQGWKTTAAAASQAIDFRSYVVPVQGTTNPTGYLTLESSVNGAAFGKAFNHYSNGNLQVPNGFVLFPASDSAQSILLGGDLNGVNAVIRIDTTNGRAGINKNNPGGDLDVNAGFIASASKFSVGITRAGQIDKYNNVATAGLGVAAIVKAGRVTAQSAASASISTYTVGAADGSFEVSMNINVTAATALSTSLNCDYTDESNTARTMIFPTTSLSGTFLTGGLVTATGAFETPVMHIRCKASTAITLYTAAGTFTSVTYTAEGIIKQTA